jgi:hypothetical protein
MRPRRAILGVVLGRRFDGKVCVVNGAASTVGEAVSERFARESAKTIGVDRVNHAVGDLALSADLVNEWQVEAMYQRIVDRFGRLDVIYNNVGLMDRGDRSALSTDLDTWHRVGSQPDRGVPVLQARHQTPARRRAVRRCSGQCSVLPRRHRRSHGPDGVCGG